MKRIAFCLSSVMVLSLSSFAQAEETDAEETLKSVGEFIIGGVWTAEGGDGEDGIQFSWFGKNKFIRIKFIRISGPKDKEPMDLEIVIGVDPTTKKVSTWVFMPVGFRKGTMAQQEKGVWISTFPVLSDDGQESVQVFKCVRVGQDECSIEAFLVANGVEYSLASVCPKKYFRP